MFKRLFARSNRQNREIVDPLYLQIVAAARQPVLYAEWGVPDTPLGRYEMLALHQFLVLHRLRGEAGAAAEVGQQLTDDFFKEVEHSIRELGIGDMGVPKRMKKLVRMFYGRVAAYDAALETSDAAALAEALRRNVSPEAPEGLAAAELVAYVMAARDRLAGQTTEAILSGRLDLPAAKAPMSREAAE